VSLCPGDGAQRAVAFSDFVGFRDIPRADRLALHTHIRLEVASRSMPGWTRARRRGPDAFIGKEN